MKYEIIIKHKTDANERGYIFYSNYANTKRDLKEKLDYLVNVLGYKLNDTDEYDNVQVSKRLKKDCYEILSATEILDEVN